MIAKSLNESEPELRPPGRFRLPCIDDASRRHANSQLETVRFIAHSLSTRSQWEIHTSFFSSAFILLLPVSTCVSSFLLPLIIGDSSCSHPFLVTRCVVGSG